MCHGLVLAFGLDWSCFVSFCGLTYSVLIPVRAGWFLVLRDKANTNVGLVLSKFVETGNRRGVFLGLIRAHTEKKRA